jgi:O-antigen/teichoic acid export membrane protein
MDGSLRPTSSTPDIEMTGRKSAIRLSAKILSLRRYALPLLAPSSVSAAHLITQIVLLSHLSAAEFGLFAFLMVMVQFGFGLSNALICTPYMVNVGRSGSSADFDATYFTVNILFSILFGAVVLIGATAAAGGDEGYVYALFAIFAMIRWFGRAYNYAHLNPTRAAISDIAYAVSLIACIFMLSAAKQMSTLTVSAAFLFAGLFSCFFLGARFIGTCLSRLTPRALSAYPEVWRTQARWTLLGVVTTESTANIHSYLVTLLVGPSAFAPISAGALFVRPVLLALTSLTQLEAPVLARTIAKREFDNADQVRRRFHLTLMALWVATGLLAWGIIAFFPSLIIKPTFSRGDIITALLFFMAISLIQVWQTPNSAALQAANRFEALSKVSVVSCLFSIAGVLISLFLLPPVYSLAGIAIGQLVMAVLTARLTSRWCHARHTHEL